MGGCRVGHLGPYVEPICLEAQVPGSREMHGKLQCGASLNLTWPSSGQGLEHDLSRLWIHQVKPVDSLLPIRNAPTGREAREFYNFFLDK